MAVDPRQVLSAFLTLSMFAMLSNMVRRDYFDSYDVMYLSLSLLRFLGRSNCMRLLRSWVFLSFSNPEFVSTIERIWVGVMLNKNTRNTSENAVNVSRLGYDRSHLQAQASFQGVSGVQIGMIKVEDKGDEMSFPKGPWKERENELKPCWTKPGRLAENSKGYITFSLTGGPGQHELQIANAVVVSRFLGAVLVLPEIRGKELGQRRKFADLYDVGMFASGLEGVVEVAAELPAEVAAPPAVIRIPAGVSEAYIRSHVEPVFRKNQHVRLATFSRSIPESNPGDELGSVRCMATYEALALTKENLEVAESMVNRLRDLGDKADGRFVAVDLRLDALDSMVCKGVDFGERKCHSPEEVVDLLTKAGFNGDTTVYLTQTWWNEQLDSLKRVFPRTFTKDDIISPEKKSRILGLEWDELGKALDLYICSQSDAFLPAISDLPFSGYVAGKRVAAGRTHFLSLACADYGGHMAHQCYC